MSSNADSFDWVTARHVCSVGAIFEKLRLGVKADIEVRQKLRERYAEFGFVNSFVFVASSGKFSASFRSSTKHLSIIFSLSGNYILVQDESDKELFRGTVTLNNDKECRIMVGEDELEEWQFRKKALESLFFGEL